MSMYSEFKTKHTKWQICDCCRGEARVDHPAFSQGFTSLEWKEMADDWDAEGETNAQERYLRGDYDIPCNACSGLGRVKVPDWSSMPRADRRAYIVFLRERREEAEFQCVWEGERQAELRMGC